MLNYPTTWSEQQIHDAYAANEQKRLEHYVRAWNAYNGDLPDALKVTAGGLNDNVKVSKCRVIVDTGVAFLFGDTITFDIDKEKQRNAAEQYLDDVWAVNRKMTLLTKLATNGGVCGHAFLKIVPGYALTSPYPRLIVLDPANVNVTWDDDDIENVVAYRIQWKAIDPKTGRGVSKKQELTRQDNGTWLIVDYMMREGYVSAKWEEVSRVTWLYSWPPVIDCQNIPVPNEFYGESDIPNDIIDLNRSRNSLLSNWARIIKFQAHQRMWGKGFREDQIKLGADDVFIIGSENGQLNSIDPPTNLAGLDTFDRRIDEAIHEAARVPSVVTGKMENTGSLSGVALKILYGPLEQKTQVKRRTYGDMLNELNRRLLELAGYGPTNVTSIAWPSVVPLDEQAERATAQADLDMGVASKSTIASKLGYDYETEQQHLAEETAAQEGDESALPTQDEADVLKTTFEAGKAAIDMGMPFDLFAKKYLGWTDAEIAQVVEAAEAEEEANALEARERMDAMREGGLIGQQQQPGQPGQDEGATNQGVDGRPDGVLA